MHLHIKNEDEKLYVSFGNKTKSIRKKVDENDGQLSVMYSLICTGYTFLQKEKKIKCTYNNKIRKN